MPEELVEAPGIDFLVNLRLSVELAPDSGVGWGLFHIFINGEAGEQVTVESTRNEKGEIEGKWSTADLFLGPRSVAFPSGQTTIDVRNFTPLPGVRPGLNDFSVTFEQGGKIKFTKALVTEATGIEVTHARPPKLKIEPELPREQVTKGRSFQIKFKLRNAGTVPARKVSARLESSAPKLLVIEGRDSFSFQRLLDEEIISFKARGVKYGVYKLKLAVSSLNANSPLAMIETPIVREEDHGGGFPWGLIGLLAGLILLAWGASRLFVKRRSARR